MIRTESDTNWRSEGACRGEDQIVFFSLGSVEPEEGITVKEILRRTERAREICAHCPVKIECLDDALSRNEKYGIWGGKTPDERQIERKRQRRRMLRQSKEKPKKT